ncbi:MAG TPA: Lrp/AsnC family transcriptional regulator [Candidatus Obscuribacterales bacterium]
MHEILTILERDSRTAPATIANMLGMSADEVKQAIGKLEADGIIKKYSAVIDWEKAGVERVVAFIDVKVTPARDVGFDAIAGRVARFPQVKTVWLVSGGSDLRVVVEAPNLRELATFVAEKLATIDGVTGTVTHFVLRRYKEEGALFLDLEQDSRLVVSP